MISSEIWLFGTLGSDQLTKLLFLPLAGKPELQPHLTPYRE